MTEVRNYLENPPSPPFTKEGLGGFGSVVSRSEEERTT
jgi:hypothetical protein